MSNTVVPSLVTHSIGQRITPTGHRSARLMVGLFVLLITLPMARSQTYPLAFYATNDFHYNVGVAANTAPGVVAYSNSQLALLIWCGTGGYVQTAIQQYPGYPGTVNTTSIPCTGGGGNGRISVTRFDHKFYAVGQPLNVSGVSPFTIISSSDGVNWTSNQMNVTYAGFPDGTFDLGFGLSTFSINNQTELVLAYASTFHGGEGPSIAVSTDGVNFTWQAVVSSNAMYDETGSWDQSPAAWQWLQTEGGNNNLYVSYFTTGAEPVIAQSADGVNWTSTVSSIGIFNRDAMLFAHDSALWFGAQSYYGEDNIWIAGTLDGTNFGYEDDNGGEYASAYNQGGVVTTSPVATEQAGDYLVVLRGSDGNLWVSYGSE